MQRAFEPLIATRPASPACAPPAAIPFGCLAIVQDAVVGGETFEASLASARRVTGRVVVTGLPAGGASLTNWDLVYENQVHIIGFNMGC